jgi:hypothetical protein
MSVDKYYGMMLAGENGQTWRLTYPSVALSTTNPIWTGPATNPSLRGERPANSRLSYGTALNELNHACLVSLLKL